jgi:hypothetical protein
MFRPASLRYRIYARPIPRLWPCSSSGALLAWKLVRSSGATGCSSTSAAVRCELSRLSLWEACCHHSCKSGRRIGLLHIGKAVGDQSSLFSVSTFARDVSSMERPPKNLNSTMRLCCELSLASWLRASSKATMSRLRVLKASASSSVSLIPPSRLAAFRARA